MVHWRPYQAQSRHRYHSHRITDPEADCMMNEVLLFRLLLIGLPGENDPVLGPATGAAAVWQSCPGAQGQQGRR